MPNSMDDALPAGTSTSGRANPAVPLRYLVRPVLYGLSAFALVLAMVWKVQSAEGARYAEEARTKSLQTLSLVRSRLEGAVNSHVYLTRGLVGFVRAHPDIPKGEFDTIARELIKGHSGIRAVQLARDGIVSHVYPSKGNEGALGLDLRTLPGQSTAVERAIMSGDTVVAGPVELVQGGSAFISRSAIFVGDGPGERFWGLTSLLVDRDHLLEEAELDEFAAEFRVAIRGKDGLGADGEVFLGDATVFHGNDLRTDIRLPGGSWQLALLPIPERGRLPTGSSAIVWLTGLILAMTTGGLVGVLAYRPQQMLRVNEQLRRARAEAERAAEARSRFLAAASHDLRQPLHALGIFVRDLVERGRHLSELQPLIEKIQLSAESLTELIHSVMDISRLDAGVVKPKIAEFPMRPLLERLAIENAPYAMEKGLRLRVAPTRAIVRSDPILLECMLRNLLVNAIKYTSHGGILVGCRIRGDMVHIEVRDTGRGIVPSDQERIFEEFVQLDAERDRRDGLGLGLSIVRRMAALLGHGIRLRSLPGRGSVFFIDAPRAKSALGAAAIDNLPFGFSLKCLTVLIVDDEPLIREAMQGLLEKWGCRALVAGGGDEALELLAGGEVKPNLLLCDFALRDGERGDQVIERLREAAGVNLEAILISGHNTDDVYRAAESCGCRFLNKPVAPAKLRALLRRIAQDSIACNCNSG